MVEALERMLASEDPLFSAEEVRLRCMPHTVHLSAQEVLSQHLGRISFTSDTWHTWLASEIHWCCKPDKKDTYQDSATAPLDRECDEDIGDDVDEPDPPEDALDGVEHALSEVLTAIPKVSSLLVYMQCKSNGH